MALTPPKAADLRIIVRLCLGLHTRKMGPLPGKELGDLDWTEHGIYALNRNVTLECERRKMYARGEFVVVNGTRVDDEDGICSHIAVGTRKDQGYSSRSGEYRNPNVVSRRPSKLIHLETFVESWKDDTGFDWDTLQSSSNDG